MLNDISFFHFDFSESNQDSLNRIALVLFIKTKNKIENPYSNLIPLFFNIPIYECIYYLESFVQDKNGGIKNKNIGFIKGPEIDNSPGGFKLSSEEILIFSELNNPEIYKVKDFYIITLTYAHKLIESVVWYNLLEKGIVDKVWVQNVKQWIIDNEDFILKMNDN
jgi:hypothetical protein